MLFLLRVLGVIRGNAFPGGLASFAVKLFLTASLPRLSFAAMPRYSLALVTALVALAAGCARLPTGVTQIKAATPADLRQQILDGKPDVDQFRVRGPFEVDLRKDRGLDLPGRRVEADWYLAALPGKRPLVVLLHGDENSKEDHSYQGLHLATWGIHAVAVGLPNRGPWVDNGRTLAGIVSAIRRRPELLEGRVDPDRIILAGHSFGGAAVVVAMAEGAPVAGGILLDPASLGKAFHGHLKRVDKPVLLLGADEWYSPVKDRPDFFFYIPRGIAEISVTDSYHDDAEFRLEPADDPAATATEDMQITFVSALTATALSLAYTGNLDYAWKSFAGGLESGKFSKAMRK